MIKHKARRRLKRLWSRRSRRTRTADVRTARIIGRGVGGQWSERRGTKGGMYID